MKTGNMRIGNRRTRDSWTMDRHGSGVKGPIGQGTGRQRKVRQRTGRQRTAGQ